mmetsp:Transcript_27738/g.32641  ORF Transcript_27738/g.32641 Transcript_27738/m.32641 type:complete len:150 (-) Transcript_27738:89-538(-)
MLPILVVLAAAAATYILGNESVKLILNFFFKAVTFVCKVCYYFCKFIFPSAFRTSYQLVTREEFNILDHCERSYARNPTTDRCNVSYTCYTCAYQTSSIGAMVKHISESHFTVPKWTCRQCFGKFDCYTDLGKERHMASKCVGRQQETD